MLESTYTDHDTGVTVPLSLAPTNVLHRIANNDPDMDASDGTDDEIAIGRRIAAHLASERA